MKKRRTHSPPGRQTVRGFRQREFAERRTNTTYINLIRRKIMSKGHGVSGYNHTQRQLDDYANQHNPNNQAYWDNLNNHSNQCNPNNDEYWHSRENDEDDE